MWPFTKKEYVHQQKAAFDAYKEWVKKQKCIDCGAKASEPKENGWVTETQCRDCFCKLGAPENRGLPGAAASAAKDGIYV